MITDQIADLLTRIRNAGAARHDVAVVPASKEKKNILDVLERSGYIAGYKEINSESAKPTLEIALKYEDKDNYIPVIKILEKVSKPGRRVYVGKDDIPLYRGGLGTYIVSTSSGVLSDAEARSKGVGGELICSIF